MQLVCFQMFFLNELDFKVLFKYICIYQYLLIIYTGHK